MRATPFNPKKPSRTFSGSRPIGRHSAVSGRGNAKPGGMTPTISTRSRSISTTRPTTPGSAPNRLLHNPSPSTTTGAAPGRSSSAVIATVAPTATASVSRERSVRRGLAAARRQRRRSIEGNGRAAAKSPSETSLNVISPRRRRRCGSGFRIQARSLSRRTSPRRRARFGRRRNASKSSLRKIACSVLL